MQSILVIDDSPEVHTLLDERLSEEGWQLYHALDGTEGLRLAKTLRPDLILLDMFLAHESGLDVCKALQAEPVTAHVPVLFISSSAEVEDKVRAFDLGAVDYLVKPFAFEELLARLRSALRTKRYQDMLAERAHIDALTGMWNRAHFDARLQAEVAGARRYGRRLSLLMLDLDHFKNVNDRFGHPFGDHVLQGVGDRLLRASRGSDVPCRYGGEEFGIILTDTSGDSALLVAERLREGIASLEFHAKGKRVPVTVSIGVASPDYLEQGANVTSERLVAEADAALYAAKRAGRNCVVRSGG